MTEHGFITVMNYHRVECIFYHLHNEMSQDAWTQSIHSRSRLRGSTRSFDDITKYLLSNFGDDKIKNEHWSSFYILPSLHVTCLPQCQTRRLFRPCRLRGHRCNSPLRRWPKTFHSCVHELPENRVAWQCMPRLEFHDVHKLTPFQKLTPCARCKAVFYCDVVVCCVLVSKSLGFNIFWRLVLQWTLIERESWRNSPQECLQNFEGTSRMHLSPFGH